MRSTIAIEVSAPADLVFALARDVNRWERLLPHYARSRAVENRTDGSVVVDFVARRQMPLVGVTGLAVPVTWRARTWHEPATHRLRFVHVAGATKVHDGFVDRGFTRPIAGRTLATFKALAEALAATPATDAGS